MAETGSEWLNDSQITEPVTEEDVKRKRSSDSKSHPFPQHNAVFLEEEPVTVQGGLEGYNMPKDSRLKMGIL